jgi:hypothetical protein
VDTKSIWIQRIERRSLIARVVELANVMNKKSMLDRDNVELYIMSEEEEQMLVDFIMELDEINTDMELQEWQNEILKKEIGDE